MGLIDADLLKKNCKCTGEFEDNFKCVSLSELAKVIDEQPTAFNMDKVIGQLEEELKLAGKEKARCIKENYLQFDSAKGYAMGVFNAIEIVKGGGVE